MELMMSDDRPRYGPLVAALGAALLGVSVFLPWYDVMLGPDGVALLERTVGREHLKRSALTGHAFAALSAHQVLKYISVILLISAGSGLVLALIRLASASPMPLSGSGPIALLGVFATVCVLFRMGAPPQPPYNWLSLSVREGAWLALVSSITMIVGGLWPGRSLQSAPHPTVDDGLSGLSG